MAAFLPPAGRGRVLITSQNPNWRPARRWRFPCSTRTSRQVSWSTAPATRTGQAARDLAVELGGLPLALEQAAAYMQATGDTLAGYLALFRQRRAEMLARGEPTGYDKTVASTWALAFDRLQQTAPGAVGLLRLLAFCAPEAIPLRLLLQPRPGLAGQLGDEVAPVLAPLLEDPLAAGDAIGALRRYSLVTPAADGSVSVHRLVQAVTADQMPAELAGEWRQAAAALIEAAIPGDTEHCPRPGRYARRCCRTPRRLSPMTATGWLELPITSDRAAVTPRPEISSGEYLTHGNGSSARSTRSTLAARRELAHWTGEAGDPAAARDQFAELLPVLERVLGPEHPDTLAARANLARWTGQAGDPAAARDQFAALLPVRERVLGPEHPDTLTARARPRPLDRGGGGPGRRPGPVRRAAARARAGPRPGAPGHPGRPARPRLLDRGGGGPGRRPGPVRRAAARARAGPRPGAPGHPGRPAPASPAGPGRRGIRPPPGTSSPRCCPCSSGSSARSTRTPWSPAPTSPAGPGRRGTRPPPGTSSPRCCRCASGSSARSTRTP